VRCLPLGPLRTLLLKSILSSTLSIYTLC
jgi:hypothetical protein